MRLGTVISSCSTSCTRRRATISTNPMISQVCRACLIRYMCFIIGTWSMPLLSTNLLEVIASKL